MPYFSSYSLAKIAEESNESDESNESSELNKSDQFNYFVDYIFNFPINYEYCLLFISVIEIIFVFVCNDMFLINKKLLYYKIVLIIFLITLLVNIGIGKFDKLDIKFKISLDKFLLTLKFIQLCILCLNFSNLLLLSLLLLFCVLLQFVILSIKIHLETKNLHLNLYKYEEIK